MQQNMPALDGDPQQLFDVVIAGAGPAGAATAIILRQNGYRVALIDSISATQPKVGESIPAATSRLLKRLGIEQLADLLASHEYKPCIANASAWGSDHWVYQDAFTNPEGHGWHIDRKRFDAALRERAITAGVVYLKGKVRLIEAQEGGYQIDWRSTEIASKNAMIQTKWIIDATGRASKIARLLEISKTAYSEQMAAVGWFHAPDNDQDQVTRIKSVRNGWWYTALLPNQTRIAVFHGLLATVRQLTHQPTAFIQAFESAQLLNIPSTDWQLKQAIQARDASVSLLNTLAKDYFLAVGDAALSFDPLSSQGIFFALYSGIQGAETVIRREEFGAITLPFERYTTQVQRVFQANQKSRAYFYQSERRFLEETYWNLVSKSIFGR